MGKMQRNKGARWERDLAKLFAGAMPGANVRRGLCQVRDSSEMADVENPVFWVEAKVGKKPNPRAALKQAVEAAPKGRVPVAVIKDDRQTPFVAMQLEDFLDFVGEWWERSQD